MQSRIRIVCGPFYQAPVECVESGDSSRLKFEVEAPESELCGLK